MQTTLEIDEKLLKLAEQAARQRGKSVAALVEEALAVVVQPLQTASGTHASANATDGLEDNDPFFSALEEIRARGRAPTIHREVRFQ